MDVGGRRLQETVRFVLVKYATLHLDELGNQFGNVFGTVDQIIEQSLRRNDRRDAVPEPRVTSVPRQLDRQNPVEQFACELQILLVALGICFDGRCLKGADLFDRAKLSFEMFGEPFVFNDACGPKSCIADRSTDCKMGQYNHVGLEVLPGVQGHAQPLLDGPEPGSTGGATVIVTDHLILSPVQFMPRKLADGYHWPRFLQCVQSAPTVDSLLLTRQRGDLCVAPGESPYRFPLSC